jgi:hypothetical protein
MPANRIAGAAIKEAPRGRLTRSPRGSSLSVCSWRKEKTLCTSPCLEIPGCSICCSGSTRTLRRRRAVRGVPVGACRTAPTTSASREGVPVGPEHAMRFSFCCALDRRRGCESLPVPGPTARAAFVTLERYDEASELARQGLATTPREPLPRPSSRMTWTTTSHCARRSMGSPYTRPRGRALFTPGGARRCCATCCARRWPRSASSRAPTAWCASP